MIIQLTSNGVVVSWVVCFVAGFILGKLL